MLIQYSRFPAGTTKKKDKSNKNKKKKNMTPYQKYTFTPELTKLCNT